MDQDIIESFLNIVQYQTISAAAQAMYVSQSTISHRIQVLERELNTKLFNRERGFKKMELTEEGKRFFPLAVQWLEINSCMRQICTSHSLGKIRIGSMDSLNQYLLAPIISQIHENLPDLQMQFTSYHSKEIYSRLSTHQLDIGFAFFPTHYDIVATPVFSEPVYMLSLPGSDYAPGPIHPSQLSKKDEIFFPWDERIVLWNNEWWDELEPPFVNVDSCGLLTTFMKTPKNWALCPASVATSLRAQYNMEVRNFIEPPPNRICYLLRRKAGGSHAAPSGIDIFVEQFDTLLRKHPWRYPGSEH